MIPRVFQAALDTLLALSMNITSSNSNIANKHSNTAIEPACTLNGLFMKIFDTMQIVSIDIMNNEPREASSESPTAPTTAIRLANSSTGCKLDRGWLDYDFLKAQKKHF